MEAGSVSSVPKPCAEPPCCNPPPEKSGLAYISTSHVHEKDAEIFVWPSRCLASTPLDIRTRLGVLKVTGAARKLEDAARTIPSFSPFGDSMSMPCMLQHPVLDLRGFQQSGAS